jgi:type IV pilus assembly protein PilP
VSKFRATLGLIASFALVGCAQDMSGLRNDVAEVLARPGGRLEQPPPPKPYEEFIYEASELRSPFAQEIRSEVPALGEGEADTGGIRPPANHNRQALEEFPLDSLRMVGTVDKDGTLFALVTNSDGEIFRIRPGNYMGLNYGRIIQIDEATITLMEIVPDGLGGWMEREATVSIADD